MKKIMEKYKEQFEEVLNDLKTPGRRHRQIPNILTGSRLFSPFVIIPSVIMGNFAIAGISTAIFAITDLFDGLVARSLKVTSDFGKDLDAFTDKVFIGTLLISLVFTNPAYALPLIMEGTIAGVNINKKINNQNPESHLIGKVKMTSLYILVALGFMNMYVKVPPAILNTLFVSTIGLQTATVIDYSKKETRKNENAQIEVNDEKLEQIDDVIEDKQKTKEKTTTEKYLEQYRNLRNEALNAKVIEEQEEKINENIKVNIKKNNRI